MIKQFKKDTINKISSLQVVKEPSINLSSIDIKPKKKISKIKLTSIITVSVVGGLVLSFAALIIIPNLKIKESVNSTYKSFKINDESSSFAALNSVSYPDQKKQYVPVADIYKEAVNEFSYDIFYNSSYTDNNFSFSPLGLYTNLTIVGEAASEEYAHLFDDVLHLDSYTRKTNLKNTIKNDFYVDSKGTTQLYNAFFLSSLYDYNPDFISTLSSLYTEAFQLDFTSSSDVDKMKEYVNTRMNDKEYVGNDFFQVDENTRFEAITSLYFSSQWNSKFVKDNNYVDDFYDAKGNTKGKATYMTHTYMGEYYQYDKYCSFYDYYQYGMKVKYIVPNDTSSSIFDIAKDINIFSEEGEAKEGAIEMSLPKLSSSYTLSFADALSSLGLKDIFDIDKNSLSKPFTSTNEDNIYLQDVKQKNSVIFEEDGTIVKSLTLSIGAGSSAPIEGGIAVKLNQPFIYIIYDSNDVPLFVGNVTTPEMVK